MHFAWRLLPFAVWTLGAAGQESVVIEDFEGYSVGEAPHGWSTPNSRARRLEPLEQEPVRDNDYFEIVESDGKMHLRGYTRNETVQIAKRNKVDFHWDLRTHPVLRWRWRATQLPVDASENLRRLNDTGAALYVMFDCGDWLGRPCSLKYTYSSALPVETMVRHGPVRVVVVSSAVSGIGDWIQVERNVAEDLKRIFKLNEVLDPELIMLWSDTDTTEGVAEVYFDDIVIHPGR